MATIRTMELNNLISINNEYYVNPYATDHSDPSIEGSIAYFVEKADGSNIVIALKNKHEYTVKSNYTIPSNVCLYVQSDSLITVPAGVTLNLNCVFNAGLYPVFNCYGNVIFGNGSAVNYYPQWFNVKGDGTTDDSAMLQKYFNSVPAGGCAAIPTPLQYYKVESTITITKPMRIIGEGDGYVNEHLPSFVGTTSGMTMFLCNTYETTWENISFVGDGTTMGQNATIVGILFSRTGDSDIDSWVRKCKFFKLSTAIIAQGMNLRVFDNIISWCIIGIDITQNGASNECRGHRISENRFHSMGYDYGLGSICVRITGAINYVYANDVINNYADGVEKFFYGIAQDSQISRNYVRFALANGIDITYGVKSKVENNNIRSRYTGTGTAFGNGINCVSGVAASIAFNTIDGKEGHGIYLTTTNKANIVGNTIYDCDWNDTGNYDGIYLGSGCGANNIDANNIGVYADDSTGVRYGINIVNGGNNFIGVNYISSCKTAAIYDGGSGTRNYVSDPANYRRIIYSSARPTSGEHREGDINWNIAPDNLDPIGWQCISTGTPGTWKAMGSQSGTTAERSTLTTQLTSNDAGIGFWDSTLGKMVFWNGSAWKNADGTTP